MIKLLATLTIILISVGSSYAQYYANSAGLRLGGSSGITYKRFVTEVQAFELLLSWRDKGTQLTGLYMWNKPLNIGENEKFFFYYGGGSHFGYVKRSNKVLYYPGEESSSPSFYYEDKAYFSMGVDAILGIEYRFLSIPVTIALDTKPYFSFQGFRYTRSDFWDSSFAIKYTF